MIDDGRELLVRGTAAAKAGSRDEARRYLELCLLNDPSTDIRIQALRYLADLAESAAQKREYIGKVLAIDPTDGEARRALAILDGRLDPADIVNPDRAPLPVNDEDRASRVERLSCPRCGSGRLIATDGRTLTCEHCHFEQPLVDRGAGSIAGRDFVATLWTARGHRAPEHTPTFTCSSCGAAFLLPPGLQSLTCSFCGGVYVNVEGEPRDFIPPDATLPFATDAAAIDRVLKEEADVETTPSPIFLPVWMFSFAGFVHWTGYTRDPDNSQRRRTPAAGDYTVLDQSVLVCATSQLPDSLGHIVDDFDLAPLMPYDPKQLAGRPVAAYQMSLDTAAVPARRKAVRVLGEAVREELTDISDIKTTFGRIGIDRFKLLLLPFWIADVGSADVRRRIFVNGQNGAIGGPARGPGFLSMLARLTGFSRGDA